MEIEDIKELCKTNGMPTEGWFTRSLDDCPVQIFDNDCGFKAILTRPDGRIRIFDKTVSRIHPVIDTGSNDWLQQAILIGGVA